MLIQPTTKRLVLAHLLCAVAATGWSGCLPGAPTPPEAPPPPAPAPAQADMAEPTFEQIPSLPAKEIFYRYVQPSLTGCETKDAMTCRGNRGTCGPCHQPDPGVAGAPSFLHSDYLDHYDPYQHIRHYPNFIDGVTDPDRALLLNKGRHEGDPLSMSQYDIVRTWIAAEIRERDNAAKPTFKPQVKPFLPTLTTDKNSPKYNKIDLAEISAKFIGAYVRFIATELPNHGGLEVSDLRAFNTKADAMAGEARTIHFNHPLFVLWAEGKPIPDPVDNFATSDKTIKLNENDKDANGQDIAGAGNLIVPGIFTLADYRPGTALSLVFDVLETVGATVSNPCKPAGLDAFKAKVVPYLKATGACSSDGNCHNDSKANAGLNMSAAAKPGADLSGLCETLKFYNGLGVIQTNTDPVTKNNHPFKWDANGCQLAGFPADLDANKYPQCYKDFKDALSSWKNADK